AQPVLGALQLEFWLLMRDSQRAEYLADALAARMAGTEAAVSLHEKLLLDSTVANVVQRVAQGRGAPDLFCELERALEDVPPHEREQRRRSARLEETRLEATHPPTGQRIRLLEERPAATGRVTLDADRNARIDAELG